MTNRKKISIFSVRDFDGKDILEVGSGYGSFTLDYLVHANSILGIDTSREAVDDMLKNWPGSQDPSQVNFQQADIVNFSLQGKEFDWVIFSNSF